MADLAILVTNEGDLLDHALPPRWAGRGPLETSVAFTPQPRRAFNALTPLEYVVPRTRSGTFEFLRFTPAGTALFVERERA